MVKKEIEVKPAQNEEPLVEKVVDTNSGALCQVPEKEAQYIMSKIADICVIYQSAMNLPESSKIEKNTSFYVEEVLRVLEDHNIITR